jgi:hypothetical protein
MARTKYLALISVSKDAKEAAALQERAEDANIILQADIQAAKKAKRQAERAVDAAYAAEEFNSEDILEAKRALKEVSEDLAELTELQDELFSEITE